MTSTRLLIRQTSAGRLGGSTTGAATSAGTAPVSGVTDTLNLLDTGDSTYNYNGEYFMFTSGVNAGIEKRIASFVPSAGSLAMGNPFSSNISISDVFEINAHLSPSQWNICINAALRRCTRRREESVTVVTNQNQYSLAAITDLTRPSQVIEVILQRGATGSKFRRVLGTMSEYELWSDDDVVTLNLINAEAANVADNLEIIVAYLAPYAALSTDAATTTCDLDWVVTGTLLQALERYKHRVEEPAKNNLNRTASDLEKEFRSLSVRFAPQRAVAIGAKFV